MEDKRRIYGEAVDVSASDIREFYDKRAEKYMDGNKTRNTTVLLGDNSPEYADSWNSFEKEFVLPYLNCGEGCRILDIGCGVGRWAENMIPVCKEYVGVDFSHEMIKAASLHFEQEKNAKFLTASFQELFLEKSIQRTFFDTVIIAGVSMYINDDDLKNCFQKLIELLNTDAVVYMEESVGVEERLTLSKIWSESLEDHYNAIYRTREEYLELLNPLCAQMEIIKEGYFDQLDKKDMSETSHWYILLKKK